MPDPWSAAAIVAKFALYLGVLTATGTALSTLLFQIGKHRGLVIGFAVLGLSAAVAVFALRAANLTGDASGMSDPEMLGLLWSTPVGTAFAFRLTGLALLIVGILSGRVGLWLAVLGGVLAIWSFDHVGHVSNIDTTLLDAALTLHLLVAALWIGILTPLSRLASQPATYLVAAEVGHRFGLVASFAVPVLILVGGYMGYVLVGSFAALIGTGYGQALILKVVLVTALLGLAAANKLRFVPDLRNGNASAAVRLVTSIKLEWALILAILAATAFLTTYLTLPA